MNGSMKRWENPRPEEYISYQESEQLRARELKHIQARPGHQEEFITGLALSGGGIRSATFSLGVLQALARGGWMKIVDYLSTVSGGGYIGSSLTWFLHHHPDCKRREGNDGFGVDAANFPFGTGVRHEDSGEIRSKGRRRISVLRHLLQNLNYLFPGNGVTVASFIAVLLRGILFNLITYIPIGLILFMLMAAFTSIVYGLPLAAANLVKLANIAGGIAVVMGIFSLLYGVTSYAFGNRDALMYHLRRIFVVTGGLMLGAIAVLLILASLPLVEDFYIAQMGSGLTTTGVISSIWASFNARAKEQARKVPLGVLVFIGSTTLLYGVLLLFYVGSAWVFNFLSPELNKSNMDITQLWQLFSAHWPWIVIPLAFAFFFGWFVNINYLSLHRYYRDRLMELFMPGIEEVKQCDASRLPLKANTLRLHEVCNYANGVEGPYHIINGNIVLVGSHITKFRGRGGDNFILSPLFCGSGATGWAATSRFLKGGMTLPSAMAISGAAVNPNTGAGGEGPTRNPFLSIIMGLFNLRLGFWAHNPQSVLCKGSAKGRYPPQHDTIAKKVLWKTQCIAPHAVPNLFIPGMRDLFRFRLNEISRVVQLTDGGHFENLGVYELIRRRLDCIIVCDGAADKNFSFADFANLQEKVRLDFGATIKIDLNKLIPIEVESDHGVCKLAESGFAIGQIRYDDESEGILIYIKTTLVKGLPQDIYGYKLQHPDFPDESTGDQIFDEKQFEAYRELGFQLGQRMTAAVEGGSLPPEDAQLVNKLNTRLSESRSEPESQTKGS